MKVETVTLADYTPAPYNPREELEPGDPDWQAIAASMGQHGQVASMIVNRRTGHIVAGHQRARILTEWGQKTARAVVVDVDLETEKTMNLAVNAISGEWDYDKLEQVIEDLETNAPDLLGATGFAAGEIDVLLGRLDEQFGFDDQDGDEDPDGREQERQEGEAPEEQEHEVILSFDTLEAARAFLEEWGADPDKSLTERRSQIVDGLDLSRAGKERSG